MRLLPPLLAACLIALGVGCASSPSRSIIHEGPNGGVYLEDVREDDFQATQPIKIDPLIIAKILNGMHIGERKGQLRSFFSEGSRAERVFTDDDIAFLAPLISAALSKARSEQRVRFKITHIAGPLWQPEGGGAAVGSPPPSRVGPDRETTEGRVYAHGLSLHVSLTEYRRRDIPPDAIGGPNRYYPDPSGLDERELTFVPAQAAKPDSYKHGWDPDLTVVVDYRSINEHLATAAGQGVGARRPADASVPPAPEPGTSGKIVPPEDVQTLKDLVIRKEMELEGLKKELQSLKRQMEERDIELDALRKKSKPPPSSPTR